MSKVDYHFRQKMRKGILSKRNQEVIKYSYFSICQYRLQSESKQKRKAETLIPAGKIHQEETAILQLCTRHKGTNVHKRNTSTDKMTY